MQLLVLSDIHGNSAGLPALSEPARGADFLLVNGDLTHFGGKNDAMEVISGLKALHPRIFSVAGNCDNKEVSAVMEEEGLSIEGRFLPLAESHRGEGSKPDHPLRKSQRDIAISGIGGALPGPVSTPNEFSEEELETTLAALEKNVVSGVTETNTGDKREKQDLVLISHQPPIRTVADRAMKLKHVGSEVLYNWMIAHKPLLLLTGHIHESYGYQWYYESCVVNPGAFKDGRYAIINIDEESDKKSAKDRVSVSLHSI